MYLVVFASRKAKNLPLLFQNEEHVCEMHSFNGGPLPPSVYLQPVDRQNIIRVNLPSVFANEEWWGSEINL